MKNNEYEKTENLINDDDKVINCNDKILPYITG